MINAFEVLRLNRRGILALLLILALLACSKEVMADVNCWGGGSTVNVNLPATIHVPRDAAAGTILVGWSISPQVGYSCNSTDQNHGFGILGSAILQKTFTSVTVTGAPPGGTDNTTIYRVIESGVPGIGLAMAFESKAGVCPPGWMDVLVPDRDGKPLPWVGYDCNSRGNDGVHGRIAVAIVKTGTVSAGVVHGGIVAQATASYHGSIDSFGVLRFNFGMTPVQVIAATCEVSDVRIPLGLHFSSEFGGVGTATSAVDFAIRLDNCPAGMKNISYRIDPTTPVIDSARSVVALSDVMGVATGVGVQLLDDSGSPFKLESLTAFNAYNKTTGGSYAIPMKARYYKTSATVTAGPAHTAMTVTMSYD